MKNLGVRYVKVKYVIYCQPQNQNIFLFNWKTSTGLYRSCAALTHFSGTFDLILFEEVTFEFIVEKVWFG